MNKDLSRRVKPVMPACWARGVVVHDIQQLLKIIDVFDKKAQLWQYQQKEGEKEKSVTGEDNGSDKEEEEAMEDSTEQKEPLQVGVTGGCGLSMYMYWCILKLCFIPILYYKEQLCT